MSLTSSFNKSTEDAYQRLMKCAYEMAMEHTMSHLHFNILIKCVKANGVRLVERTKSGKTRQEFVHCIAEAVQEKCAVILGSADFF